MDVNQDILNYAKKNLNHRNVEIINHNIFENKYKFDKLDSIGFNYVLHCINGDNLGDKLNRLTNNIITPNNEKIRYFGATVLNLNNKDQNQLAHYELYLLNKYKIFSNMNDTHESAIEFFENNGYIYRYKIIGNVFIFCFEKDRK